MEEEEEGGEGIMTRRIVCWNSVFVILLSPVAVEESVEVSVRVICKGGGRRKDMSSSWMVGWRSRCFMLGFSRVGLGVGVKGEGALEWGVGFDM